jgi:hypothetical protein
MGWCRSVTFQSRTLPPALPDARVSPLPPNATQFTPSSWPSGRRAQRGWGPFVKIAQDHRFFVSAGRQDRGSRAERHREHRAKVTEKRGAACGGIADRRVP